MTNLQNYVKYIDYRSRNEIIELQFTKKETYFGYANLLKPLWFI